MIIGHRLLCIYEDSVFIFDCTNVSNLLEMYTLSQDMFIFRGSQRNVHLLGISNLQIIAGLDSGKECYPKSNYPSMNWKSYNQLISQL